MPIYFIITPVRNEGQYLQKTIDSVVAQTLRPQKWIIVNDGSTDQTSLLIDAAATQHSWIQAVHRADRGFRKSGGGVIEAFYDGYRLVQSAECKVQSAEGNTSPRPSPQSGEGARNVECEREHTTPSPLPSDGRGIKGEGWDFLVKLDGDLSFEADYFEKCFQRFEAEPKLGIGGGRVYCRVNGKTEEDSPRDPAFHVRGATKIYRRATWDAIGGLVKTPGWDTLDEVKANMLGWKTYSF